MLSALLLAGALLQQQPHRAPPPHVPTATQRASAAAFDTTTQAVANMGASVAEVKTALSLYRRAVFNGPDGDVIASGQYFQRSCHVMDSVALVTARTVCRHCGSKAVQDALVGYRAVMPALSRLGARCATRFDELLRGRDSVAVRRLRREVRVIGNEIVAGLSRYEQRLERLRVAAAWTKTAPVPPGD